MTVEQKAKAYDKAIEKLRDFYRDYDTVSNLIDVKEELAKIFPELKESEDERIRKEIITHCRNTRCVTEESAERIAKWIAWLERQCEQNPYSGVSFKYNGHAWGMCARDGGVEILMDGNLKAFISLDKSFIYPISSQSALEAVKEEKIDNQTCVKPADKFKPKFKLGDWITDGCLHCKIIQVLDECYIVDSKFGKTSIFFKREYNYHLWSIQDARDGNILAGSKDEVILMFRGIGNTEWKDVIDYHCCYDCYRKEFIKQKGLNFWGYVDNNNLKPATKKQRDLLFSKIKESGWEWDSKKKELRKGE